MPNRILRDWTDSYTMELASAEAERLFTRLIMKADDFGRYHADPRLIRAGCFPLLSQLSEEEVSGWVSECVNAGLIVVYQVGARSCLAINGFGQRLHAGARPKFPCPNGETEPWLPKTQEHAGTSSDLQEIPALAREDAARASNTHTNTNTASNRACARAWLDGKELPSVESVQAAVMTSGIPNEFVAFVYDDWESRAGKDGSGVQVEIVPYVRKRWVREQGAWKAGTHKGCQSQGTNGPSGKMTPEEMLKAAIS